MIKGKILKLLLQKRARGKNSGPFLLGFKIFLRPQAVSKYEEAKPQSICEP